MQKLDKDVHINHVKVWKTYCRNIAKGALLNLCYNSEWSAIKYKVQDEGSTSVHYFNAYDDKHLKLLNFQNDSFHVIGKRKLPNRGFVLTFLRNLIPAGTPEFRPYVVTQQDLEYPHNRLQECMQEYEKKSFFTPSAKITKQYQKMKPLYRKIKSVEDNVEE
uniref:Uncharacterized protein n=1 Tax=Panagrolaimus sp. PS1159 TaxID=55785 RepID=A0AC35ERE5_9BILA